jgi:regulator of sigma E protease
MSGILIFILFLCPLIFFHELGHFLFARRFGVRVEVFSIGFGPKIFKFKKNFTEYAISIIPLGGYVKMFGDDPFREAQLTDEEKMVAFNHKSKWARFWIVFGGPLANMILAMFLYWGLVLVGEKVPETRLGAIPKETIFYDLGFRSGDKIVSINGNKILAFDDLDISDDQIDSVVISRMNENKELSIQLKTQEFITSLFNYVSSPLRKPLLVDSKGNYFIATLQGEKFNKYLSLEEILDSQKPIDVFQVKSEKMAEGDIASTPSFTFESGEKLRLDLDKNLKPIDLMIESIVMKSPADTEGLKRGDVLVKINDQSVLSFEQMRDIIQNTKEKIKIVIWRGGEEITKELLPTEAEVNKKKIKTIGIYSAVKPIEPVMIETTPGGIVDSFLVSLTRTKNGVIKTFSGYKKLITREVSLGNIGGPLAIGKVASDSFHISLSMFFRLMAIMSINLGIINLFPVPVLDGGHILFLGLEALNGGPLSRRKMEIAQKFGLSFLFFLIFVALFNDISRFI